MAPKTRVAHKPKFENIKRKIIDPVSSKKTEVEKFFLTEATEVKVKRRTVPQNFCKIGNSTEKKCNNTKLSSNCDKYSYRPKFVRPFEARPHEFPTRICKKVESLLALQARTPKRKQRKPKIIPIKGYTPKHVGINSTVYKNCCQRTW